MSALTERRKREIDKQLAKMKQAQEKKILLYVICDIADTDEGSSIARGILKEIRRIDGIESASYIYGTEIITVISRWKEPISSIIQQIQSISPYIREIRANILDPLL